MATQRLSIIVFNGVPATNQTTLKFLGGADKIQNITFGATVVTAAAALAVAINAAAETANGFAIKAAAVNDTVVVIAVGSSASATPVTIADSNGGTAAAVTTVSHGTVEDPYVDPRAGLVTRASAVALAIASAAVTKLANNG